jgi:hypothetical protein
MLQVVIKVGFVVLSVGGVEQHKEEKVKDDALCFEDEMDGGGDGEVGKVLLSPLYTYSHIAMGETG